MKKTNSIMGKEELLRLLEDPDVINKLKEIVDNSKAAKLTVADNKIVSNLVKWWNKQTGQSVNIDSDLNIFNKKDIVTLVKGNGVRNVKAVLMRAYESPLNVNGNMMEQYLSSIVWCMKPQSYSKIDKGTYDVKFSNVNQEYQNEGVAIKDDELFV